MHELSIAVDLLEAASERAREEGARHIRAIHLRIGPLSGVISDALRSAFDVASMNTPADGAALEIVEVPITLYCANCRTSKTLADRFSFCCPDCGRPSADIRSGRELEVTALELE